MLQKFKKKEPFCFCSIKFALVVIVVAVAIESSWRNNSRPCSCIKSTLEPESGRFARGCCEVNDEFLRLRRREVEFQISRWKEIFGAYIKHASRTKKLLIYKRAELSR